MQSNAFEKSMKCIIVGLCHAVTFSIICRSVNIWSLHDLPRLKPACSCRSWLSTAAWILFSSILQNTLPGADSNVIPRELLQSARSPFFGSGMVTPFRQSDGTILLYHMMLHKWANSGMTASEYFKSSGCIWSMPAAFPFFNLFTALATSSSVICSMQTSRQV